MLLQKAFEKGENWICLKFTEMWDRIFTVKARMLWLWRHNNNNQKFKTLFPGLFFKPKKVKKEDYLKAIANFV